MLASISGGTDICSCFALGNPTLPVRKGELQAFGLGLDACALDRDSGSSVVGAKAELVCRSPFVAAPVCFFGDDEKKSKYRGVRLRRFERAPALQRAPLTRPAGSTLATAVAGVL